MGADHPTGGDETTGDHNKNGIENTRERRGCAGGTSGAARRRPLLVQPSSPHSLPH